MMPYAPLRKRGSRWVASILLLTLAGCAPGGSSKSPGASGSATATSPGSASPTPSAADPRVVVATVQKREIKVQTS